MTAAVKNAKESGQKNSAHVGADVRLSVQDGRLTAESTEQERYELLKDASIRLASVNEDAVKGVRLEDYNTRKKSAVIPGFRALAKQLGILNVDLQNSEIGFPFQFSGKNLEKSLHHQLEYGGTYQDYVRMMSCFNDLVGNAVPIEVHTDKKAGTVRENKNLKQTYVLTSAHRDGSSIVPVQLEVKEFHDTGAKLYLDVVLTKIEAEVLGTTSASNAGGPLSLLSASAISLRQIFENVNPADGRFLKYVPDGFLNEAQKNAKAQALRQQEQEYAGYGAKFSDRDSAGRELSAEQAEYFKDSKVRDKDGNLLVMYHQTDGAFTVFDTKHDGAGARDNETPFGIFLKTTDRDIGVRGKNQMALYANITNPLHAENRADLVRQLRRLSPEYDRLKTESGKLDAEYGKKHEAAKKAFVDFLVQWRRDNPTASRSAIYDDPEFNAVYDAEDNVVTEWQERQTALDTQAKEAIAEALRKNGYDGIILARDAGSFGRSTDAYIALDANQVKNPDNLAPTKNPDIRYSDRDNRAQKSIKDQIRANAAALSEMKSVANIRADLRGMNIKEKRQWAENVLKASGYRVDRQAFGVIAFEPRHINEGLNYLSDDGEIAAFAALPQLLKRGKIIDVHNNHKGRDFGTVTIAAPVEINGVRGNMAAVVKRTGKDHYHTHRILMPDGSAFEFLVQENTEPKPAGALSETDTHATPMDPVSGNRIAQNDPTVKRQERDTVSAEIATLQRDLRQMRAELKRLKGSEGQVDLAAAAQYDAREALRAAKADAKEARQVMAQRGWRLDEAAFYAVMNSLWSDYGATIQRRGMDSTDLWADLARDWLCDEDARRDKAARYYADIVEH